MSTSLVPRSFFRDLDTIRNDLNQLLSDVSDGRRVSMPIDLAETDAAIIVKATVPGIKPEDLSVTVERGLLTIRGESREERDETKGTWHLHERRAGSVYRSLMLPTAVNQEQAEATLKDGVLEIKLPKTEPSAGRRITVQHT